jgi:aspartate-semialdehyde dehydrogenase
MKVAILGATGLVGQRFVQLLSNHPFFEITALAASDNSAGKKYREAVQWRLNVPVAEKAGDMVLKKCTPDIDCDYVFSALPSDVAGEIEEEFANAGYIVFSNAASHRMDEDVPLIIPEVNLDHLKITETQKRKGKIITNPNCSTIGFTMVLKPIMDRFGIEEANVVTMQAISGAGYPGVPSMDIIDNVVPFIKNEEEKIMTESKKILGRLKDGKIYPANLDIFAQCNRVAVVDGHMLSITIKTQEKATLSEIVRAFEDFQPLKGMYLPTAPEKPVFYLTGVDSPQPKLHRDLGGGMSVSVGRLKQYSNKQFGFVALVHNTIRGAAGCAVLNAEIYNIFRG